MNELELNSQLSDVDFKKNVIKQLIKDFELIGYKLKLKQDATTIELIDEIAFKLIEIENAKASDLIKIAYVVDLGEEIYKAAVSKIDVKRYSDLAFEILKRDAYKVYLRSKF